MGGCCKGLSVPSLCSARCAHRNVSFRQRCLTTSVDPNQVPLETYRSGKCGNREYREWGGAGASAAA
jgi:hypothetical protein